MSTGSSPGGKLSVHSGSGTLRGGGVSRIYGNMASFKQYKRKIDYRLPLVTIVCIASIAAILFVYGLYQLKGYDSIVEYIESTRDISNFLSRHRRQDETAEFLVPSVHEDSLEQSVDSAIEKDNAEEKATDDEKKDEEKETAVTEAESDEEKRSTPLTTPTSTMNSTPPVSIVISTTQAPIETSTQEDQNKNNLTVPELNEMYSDFTSTHKTIWSLFAVNLIVLLFLVPATILFHFDFLEINRYKTIFRFIIILTMLFLIIQLLYLISPILTSSCSFPGYIDRLFAKETSPKAERGINDLQETFACEFNPNQLVVELGRQDHCVPKIKDSLFPCYVTILLIFLDILPFIFALFTYAWDAWIKDCTTVREARMRVELNNQRRPRTREEIIEEEMTDGNYHDANKGTMNSLAHNSFYGRDELQVR
ncbi:hypothetical protein FO519_001660 [Halicephalobus sp. NKZ332]|nr:hypothetical protein FO519_001660 [Halicephalobus sp. NKZ332]